MDQRRTRTLDTHVKIAWNEDGVCTSEVEPRVIEMMRYRRMLTRVTILRNTYGGSIQLKNNDYILQRSKIEKVLRDIHGV